MKHFPVMMLDIPLLKELFQKSSYVCNWYAHGPGDQVDIDTATVRGPYKRWFYVTGGKGYEKYLGSVNDDAKYAAAAMNMMPHLIARIEELEKMLDKCMYED